LLTEQGHRILGAVDCARRASGRLLDTVGAGPRTAAGYTVMEPAPGVRVRRPTRVAANGAPVLLVPAPIKRWYIWDLEPEVSVVRRCGAAGTPVFVVEWTDPGPGDHERGLEDYAESLLLACVDAALEQTGEQRLFLVGHSLGGTLAAVFAARHPDRVAGVVLLEAPMHFGADAGAFAPLVAAAPHAGWVRGRAPGVSGTWLDIVSSVASPREFQFERLQDLSRSLTHPSRLATHARVERWALDELAVPARLFEDVVERLYRRDELMAGVLPVAGKRVGPACVEAPLLTVVDPRSSVVPPESVLPFHAAAGSRDKRVLQYHGDVGVALQHVGVLVGRQAHEELWPQVLAWIHGVAT
jgi:polyhydroxyalkanoate synthase